MHYRRNQWINGSEKPADVNLMNHSERVAFLIMNSNDGKADDILLPFAIVFIGHQALQWKMSNGCFISWTRTVNKVPLSTWFPPGGSGGDFNAAVSLERGRNRLWLLNEASARLYWNPTTKGLNSQGWWIKQVDSSSYRRTFSIDGVKSCRAIATCFIQDQPNRKRL